MSPNVDPAADKRSASPEGPLPPPRLRIYRLLSKLNGSHRFSHRIFVIAFVGTHVPLMSFVVYLFVVGNMGGHGWILPVIVLISTLIGCCATLLALRGLTEPIDAVSHALREYARCQRLPSLPGEYNDDIGILLRDTQNTLTRVDELAHTLRRLSVKDDLTQLHNRRFLRQEGERLLAQSDRYDTHLSLMIADVDHFKGINDEHSHRVGDKVLQEIATILTQEVRDSDLIVRYGGDEFVCVFPQNDFAAVVQACERLQSRVEAHDWSKVKQGLHVTISIGVCAYAKSDTLETMLSRADAGLYQAKHQGRNRVSTVDIEVDLKDKEALEVEAGLPGVT